MRLLKPTQIALALAALVLWPCPTASAVAPTVTLHAALTPERLGHGTTMKFGFSISFPAGQPPVALRELHLRYPANLGIATSGLGVSNCRAAVLEADGPPGCPHNSVMGYGSALVEVPFGWRSSTSGYAQRRSWRPSKTVTWRSSSTPAENPRSPRSSSSPVSCSQPQRHSAGILRPAYRSSQASPKHPTSRSSNSPPRSAPAASSTTNTPRAAQSPTTHEASCSPTTALTTPSSSPANSPSTTTPKPKPIPTYPAHRADALYDDHQAGRNPASHAHEHRRP
jgi:hypothetical protein